MIGEDEQQETSEIRRQVLQKTLTEVSASRPPTDGQQDQSCVCVICLEAVSEPCDTVPCAHRNFDFLCLLSWLEQRPSCPLCKADIKKVRFGFSEDAATWKIYDVPTEVKTQRAPDAFRSREPSLGPLLSRTRRQHRSHSRGRSYAGSPESLADDALSRRRFIYQHKLYSLHVGSSRITRYTDLTPQMFETDPTLLPRARQWIRRELRVFDFLCATDHDATAAGPGASGAGGQQQQRNASRQPQRTTDRVARRLTNNAEFLLEYIVAILRTVDIRGSCGQAEEMIQEFLGREHTTLFLHELRAWLRSPYMSLEAWDRHVQYDESSLPASRSQGHQTISQGRGRGSGDEGCSPSSRHEGTRERRQSHGISKPLADRWRPSRDRYSPYGTSRESASSQSEERALCRKSGASRSSPNVRNRR